MKTVFALGCGADAWISRCCVRPGLGSAGGLLLEAAGMSGPETSHLRGADPFATASLELRQEKGYRKGPAFS